MPAWLLPLGLVAAGTAAGAAKAGAQASQREEDQLANILETKYSPWVTPQYRNVAAKPSYLGEMLGGGVMGGLAGASLQQGLFGPGGDSEAAAKAAHEAGGGDTLSVSQPGQVTTTSWRPPMSGAPSYSGPSLGVSKDALLASGQAPMTQVPGMNLMSRWMNPYANQRALY
jgi:hypothetical protein